MSAPDFTAAQLATILAALRLAQNSILGLDELSPIHFNDVEGGVLDGDEIEALCEELNCESPLDAIHAEMDGTEWSSDTLEAIKTILVDAGYEVREPLDDEDEPTTAEGGQPC